MRKILLIFVIMLMLSTSFSYAATDNSKTNTTEDLVVATLVVGGIFLFASTVVTVAIIGIGGAVTYAVLNSNVSCDLKK